MEALHETDSRVPPHPTNWTSSGELCVTAAWLEKVPVPPSLTLLRNQISAEGTCADKAACTSQQLWWSPLLLFHLVCDYPWRVKGCWKAIMPKKGDGYYLSRSILRLYCWTFLLWLFGKVAPFPSVILSCPLLEKLSTECAELNF